MASKSDTGSTNSTTDNTETQRPSRGTSINRVILVGRLVANTRTAHHRIRRSRHDRPDRHQLPGTARVPRRGPLAPARRLRHELHDEGRLAYIEGRQQSRTWEAADGSKRRTVEVVADTFKALSPKRNVETAA